VVALCADRQQGLRYAKRGGTAQKEATPFVRNALLHRAVEHAMHLAMDTLSASWPGQQQWREGIGFLRSAYGDAKAYMQRAPPDNRHMRGVMHLYIMLAPVVHGPALAADAGIGELAVSFFPFGASLPCSRGRRLLANDCVLRSPQ
jgi:hypothetical protein